MSITSFTGTAIFSLGFSNLSPVSFSKCALNLSFVIVVPSVPLCPLLHSFLRAAYTAPVFSTLLALLYQLYPPLLFLLSQTPPKSVPCCSQLFSCLPNYSCSSSLCYSVPSLHSVCYLLLHLVHFILSSVEPWLCVVLFQAAYILPLPHLLVYLLSGPSWLCSLSSDPFSCVTPGRHIL